MSPKIHYRTCDWSWKYRT